jgi:hypothetical protein
MFAAHIIKSILSLLYTGKINEEYIQKELVELMKFTSLYDLKWLKEAKAKPCCIHAIKASNLKEIWQVGQAFDSDAIKTACIAYTMRNTLDTLVNSTIQTL